MIRAFVGVQPSARRHSWASREGACGMWPKDGATRARCGRRSFTQAPDTHFSGDGQAGTANLVAIQPTSRAPSTPVLGDPPLGEAPRLTRACLRGGANFPTTLFRVAGSNDTAALLSRRLLIHRPRQPLCPSLPSRRNNSPDQAHPGLPHIFSPSADIPRPSSDQDSSPATFLVHPSLQPKALVSNRNNG